MSQKPLPCAATKQREDSSSSTMTWLFRSEYFKLFLALGILGTLAGLMFYAQYQADKEEKEYQANRAQNPTAERVSVDNYELKEVDDSNRLRWKLSAKSGIFEKDKKIHLTDICMQYFDGEKVKMKVIAPTGLANETNRQVELTSSDKQKVVAEGEEGKSRLETSRLELTKKNGFKATGGVNIVWSGVAKVTGDYATGVFGKKELEDLKIIGNTHAIIQ